MTNAAAIGYTIMALQNLGYSKEEIKLVVKQLWYLHDMIKEDEAEEVYNKN